MPPEESLSKTLPKPQFIWFPTNLFPENRFKTNLPFRTNHTIKAKNSSIKLANSDKTLNKEGIKEKIGFIRWKNNAKNKTTIFSTPHLHKVIATKINQKMGPVNFSRQTFTIISTWLLTVFWEVSGQYSHFMSNFTSKKWLWPFNWRKNLL